MQEISIVGGGLAGLVAAIHVAKAGGSVTLHEAAPRLAGRARTDAGPHKVNLGPHALYRRGDFGRWLQSEKLLPKVYYPSLTGLRMLVGGKLKRNAPGLIKVMRMSRLEAPVDEDFRTWATRTLGEKATETAIGFASLPTYHADPGCLSAAFVHDRISRSAEWRPVWYLHGGWNQLVHKLEQRARELGVVIHTASRLRELPAGICIVATDLASAAKLLGEPDLSWPGPRCALFDVALRQRRGDPTAVLDLDGRVYCADYAAADASVAPERETLIQAVAAVAVGEDDEAAQARIHFVLDKAYQGWRDRTLWRRTGVTRNVGPADPPGTTWRDRPAIDRGAGRFLIGDHVAAPGLLAEVAFESARIAAAQAVRKAS